ncbi:RDD family protein [Alteromonas facilis]|uniref:RDD family protein n=1 Tax=Alteromonas facilis TaxID=2048004 RepID=UPI001F0CB5B5|nr:RDD family protein [Alteromonas facilis]
MPDQLPTSSQSLTPQSEPPAKPDRTKDDKTIVTPYAFGIADDLLGLPTASPSRRLFAILIDLLLIALLSSLNALFLAGFAAITFLRTNIRLAREKRFRRTRNVLSAVIAVLIFAILFGIVDTFNQDNDDTPEGVLTGGQAIATGALILAWNSCEDGSCKSDVLDDFSTLYAESKIARADFGKIVRDFLREDTTLTDTQRQQMEQQSMALFDSHRQTQEEDAGENQSAEVDSTTDTTQQAANSATSENTTNQPVVDDDVPADEFSIVTWLKTVAADLGIGFGWAALYFSAFTTIWKGSTPGKRLMGIYVVRIDGKIPSLWESFERYGGYGAGLATGLLGFLQVLWDPNRQAIQDKISETLVLRRTR